jgi:hypothetical protein
MNNDGGQIITAEEFAKRQAAARRGAGMVGNVDLQINPESLLKFKAQMREMREAAEGVLAVVNEALAKARELEKVKDALQPR